MEAKLRFSLADASGKVKAMGEGSSVLGQDDLVINPLSGNPLHLSLRDIASIAEGEYRIFVQLRSSDSLMLFNLGQRYEDFARELFRSANELELKDLLMDERLLKQGVRCEFALTKEAGKKELGKAEARLYQTALVVMPEHASIYRARFADVLSTDAQDHRLQVSMEGGDILELVKLGRELDPLRKGIMDGAMDLSTQVQRMIKDAFPEADAANVPKAARLMREGRAAGRRELEEACPGLWSGLEKKVAGYGIGEEYAFLSGLARKEGVRVGIKRQLHKEDEQDYVFFLAPIFSMDAGRGGNAVAFEASSGEDEGRATYFFRIWGRKQYPLQSLERMDQEAGGFVASLAAGLNAVNFRREPIYLPEEKLYAPEHSRYRYAIMRVPELGLLRESYVGRVMHSSPEQWREDVAAMLSFNVGQKDDSAKWKKAEEGQ